MEQKLRKFILRFKISFAAAALVLIAAAITVNLILSPRNEALSAGIFGWLICAGALALAAFIFTAVSIGMKVYEISGDELIIYRGWSHVILIQNGEEIDRSECPNGLRWAQQASVELTDGKIVDVCVTGLWSSSRVTDGELTLEPMRKV